MTSVDWRGVDAEANVSSQVIAAFLDAHTMPNGLVVDPFCHDPTVVTEAMRVGRRVVATNLNPLDVLCARTAVSPVPAHEITAAMARLSDVPKSGTPLREHIQHLYRTECPRCGSVEVADYFVWEREQGTLKQVVYRCRACQRMDTRECDASDVRVALEVQPRGLHYWYVLDRIARHEDRGRKLAERLLELYTPRNLYALSNLVLKIDDLFAGSAMHDWMRLCLLHCLELGSKLHTPPGEPAPAHAASLTPPVRFVEWNIWLLIEEAVQSLIRRPEVPQASLAENVKAFLSSADASPASAFIGWMPVRQLAQELPPGSAALILGMPPQFGRTRWAMPFLWCGWLYGHAASATLWPLIRRRASDWPSYLNVMKATFRTLQKALTPGGSIIFWGQSNGLALHETMALAAAGTGLHMECTAYSPNGAEASTRPFAGLRGDYRWTWTQGAAAPPWPMSVDELWKNIGELAVARAEHVLEERAEPAAFARLHCAIWEALAQKDLLQRVLSLRQPPVLPQAIQDRVRGALDEQVGRTFVQLWKDAERDECLWWLVHAPDTPPLSERIEQAVCEALESAATVEWAPLLSKLSARFPGVLLPDAEWVQECLTSYGQFIAPNCWTLNAADQIAQRASAHAAMLRSIQELGERLGYQVFPGVGSVDLMWKATGRDEFAFAVLESAALSRVAGLKSSEETAQAKVVVVPDSRYKLIQAKWARLPYWHRQLDLAGWQVLKEGDLSNWAAGHAGSSDQLPLL